MRIAYLTNSLGMGGIEMNLCRLTNALLSRGHAVVVCAQHGTLTPTIVSNGGQVVDLEMRPISPVSLYRDICRLRRALSQGIDLVHVLSAKAALVLWLAIRTLPRSRRPVIVASLMGIQSSLAERQWKTLFRARVTLAGSHLVIITSPAIEALVKGLQRRPTQSVYASVVGVELVDPPPHEQIQELRATLGLQPTDHLVTTIGRLDSTKSHDLFIRAAKGILQDRSDVVFAIVGTGPLEQTLRAQAAEAGIGDDFHLLGERRDIVSLLCASTVYVRPGIVEGFVGITVLEAQSLRRPVISFDTKDVRPAIEHEVSGLLVPPNDIDCLMSAIIDLLDNPARAKAIGNAGYEQFLRTFSLDSVVENLCTIYSSATAQKPS